MRRKRVNSKIIIGIAAIAAMLFIMAGSESPAQLRITEKTVLPLSAERQWAYPVFSPNGERIYFSDRNFNGIWEYSVKSAATRKITEDPRSGYGFSISDDGTEILYRRTLNENSAVRTQEIICVDLSDLSYRTIDRGTDLQVPIFEGKEPLAAPLLKGREVLRSIAVNDWKVIGIENEKIVLKVNGKPELFDPFGNGSYIWPQISPDKKYLLAYELSCGTFICSRKGEIISQLGRKNAAVWTRDSRWIIYMNDKDDGHRTISSEIHAVSVDGNIDTALTNSGEIMEQYPSCSPVEDAIVCADQSGKIFVLRYKEVTR